MKKIVKIIVGVALLTVTHSFTPVKHLNLTDVGLENFEALCVAEDKPVFCIGDGTIDCAGRKVEVKIY